MKNLRIAMIGGAHDSHIGPTHVIASQWSGQGKLVAGAFSRNKTRSEAAGKVYGIEAKRCYASAKELFATENKDTVDIIVIATPNSTHVQYATEAAKRGFHVFCEKPLGVDVESIHPLADALERKNLVFSLAHHNTGYAAIRKMRSIVQSGDMGDLRVMRSSYIQGWLSEASGRAHTPQAAWRLNPDLSGPSCCLSDIGSHALNLMQFVGDRPIANFDATLKSFGEGREIDDFCHLLLEYDDGVLGIMTASQISTGYGNDIEMHCDCELGSLSWYRADPRRLKIRRPDLTEDVLNFEPPEPTDTQKQLLKVKPLPHDLNNLQAFASLYDSFFDRIRGKKDAHIIPIEHAAEVMTIICEATANDSSSY